MTNRPRQLSDTGLHHVVARGNGRQIIFEDDRDRQTFRAMLRRVMAEQGVSILAWCLMDNHVHLLLHDDSERLSGAMQHLLTGYARYFNVRTCHVGHVFQQRFYSEPIKSDEHLLATVRYIHLNPVKAGMALADEYAWSSYREYIGEADVCDTELVLSMLGGADGFKELCCGGREYEAGFEGSMRLSDSDVLRIAHAVARDLGLENPAALKGADLPERNKGIAWMRSAGLSIKQIERMTGIGRGAIARVKKPLA